MGAEVALFTREQLRGDRDQRLQCRGDRDGHRWGCASGGHEEGWRRWWSKAQQKQGGVRGDFGASSAQAAVGWLRPSAALCWLLLPVHGHSPARGATRLDPAPKRWPTPESALGTQQHPSLPAGKGAVGPKAASQEMNQRVGSGLSTLQPGGWW